MPDFLLMKELFLDRRSFFSGFGFIREFVGQKTFCNFQESNVKQIL